MFRELKELSSDKKHFVVMMENSAEFVIGHYHLPFPLRNPTLIMTNNRAMVDKRANYMKKRFMKNKFLKTTRSL